MSSTRRSWSRRAGALLAVTAVAAAAGPASAATPKPPASYPKVPTFQKASFKLTLKGTQVTEWQRVPRATLRDCVPTFKQSGNGKETVRVRTTKALRLDAYRTNGQTSVALRSSSTGFDEDVKATVNRSARERFEETAGSCGNPGTVTEGGPYDCGDRNRDFGFTPKYERGRIELRFGEGVLSPLTDINYRTCPIHADPRVDTNGFTAVSQSLPARDLFDRKLGKHIVLGRRTFKLKEDGFTGKTTVRELTLTRVKR